MNDHAKQMVAKACYWVRNNPEKWTSLQDFCAYLKDRDEIIQRGNIYELARRYGMDINLASSFRRDHNLWSVIARYLVMKNPSLLSSIRFRETPIDDVDLCKYWREIVGAEDFMAKSLDDARALYEVESRCKIR